MSYSLRELKNLLSIAKEAVLCAGRFLVKANELGRKAIRDLPRDVKITADIESERIIVDFLRRESHFSILSEEKGLCGERHLDKLKWIIDPLDGSLNFIRQIPISCVSVGLWDDKRPLIGAIYDFNKAELFYGIADKGSWLNDKAIKVSKVKLKKNAILLTGLPAKTDFSVKSLKSFIRDIRLCKKVRLLGSAALSLAYVASARADVYFEDDIMIWDIAAGVPIVMGAGGMCRMENSHYKHALNVNVSNKFLLDYHGNK